jgi:hypothetical protein
MNDLRFKADQRIEEAAYVDVVEAHGSASLIPSGRGRSLIAADASSATPAFLIAMTD